MSGTMGCTMVRMFCTVFGISHDIASVHGVVTHNILHLTFCPVSKIASAVYFLYTRHKAGLLYYTLQIRMRYDAEATGTFSKESRVIWIFMRNSGPVFQIPAEDIPVSFRICYWSKFCKYSAPNGIPTVNPYIFAMCWLCL